MILAAVHYALWGENMASGKSSEFQRQFRIQEALDVNSTTPAFAFSFLTAFSVQIFQVGWQALTFWAYIPLLIIIIVQCLSIKSYLGLRNRERPSNVSGRRLNVFLITSLVLGFSWGSFVLLVAPHTDPDSVMILYTISFFGLFGGATTVSKRVVLGFGLPLTGLSWLAMVLYGPLPALVPTLMSSLGVLSIIQFMQRNHRNMVENIELTLENTQSLAERLAAEEELRIAEAKAAQELQERQSQISAMQREMINATPFPLVLTHSNEAIQITPQARTQFAIGDMELSEFTLTDFFCDPRDQQKVGKIIAQDGQVDDYEVLMHGLDDKEFWVTLSMRPLEYDGKPCWLSAIYVIDARKRIEQDLAEAKVAAENALVELKTAQASLVHAEKMASIGQLTAGIAHEIKNPLNFVNNFSKLSRELLDELVEVLEEPIQALEEEKREDAEDLIDTVQQNLTKIDEHGSRADSIVKNMLAHSREGGAEMQLADLNAIAKEAQLLAFHGARATDKSFNIDLQTDLGRDVGNVTCQPQELQRVILNLCSNGMYEATKRAKTEGTAPFLKVSTHADDASYIVEVQDNGNGIPPEVQDKVFNPFFTTKPPGEGTGLGLSISYDIIKQHGGLMTFETETGRGTTLRISLPQAS